MRRGALFLAGLMVAGVAAVPARAAFHIMKVRELFPGTSAQPDAQFVELQMYSSGQNVVQGHAIRVYNAAGTQVGSFAFPGNVANGANQASILIATSQAQALFGITPDLVMSPVIALAGGAVCFDAIDCVSWGSYAPASAPDGSTQPLNPAEGLVRSASALRDISAGSPTLLEGLDDTNRNAADFDLLAPSPRNNAGSNGTLPGCVLTFAAQTVTVSEGAPSVQLTVNGCSGASASYATADGTATAGNDYTASSGTISFGTGTQASFTVPLLGDAVYEGASETFVAKIRNPSDAFLSNPDAQVVLTETSPAPGLPSAPRDLLAAAGTGSITLTWQPPLSDGGSPVTGYRVFRGSASGTETFLVALGNVLTYVDAVGNGVTRFYQVSAVTAGGEGPRSNEASATTAAGAPSAARSLGATPGNGQISLSWLAPISDGGSPITGYRIWRGTAAGQETPFTTVGAVLSFVDTGLPQGAFRSYRVAAINSQGEGPLSNTAAATTFAPPGEPIRVAAAPGGQVGEIVVQWDAPLTNGGAPVTSYIVYRTPAGGTETTAGTTTGETFIDRGLQAGTRYVYRVAAANVAGQGPRSASACTRPFPWLNALGCTV